MAVDNFQRRASEAAGVGGLTWVTTPLLYFLSRTTPSLGGPLAGTTHNAFAGRFTINGLSFIRSSRR
jgi:hypothetical protein